MMTTDVRNVMVKQLPERLGLRQERTLLRDLVTYLKADRPRLVVDCSQVRQFDRSVVHLLLRCLEEAMKHNGDVKLAAVHPAAAMVLETTGASRVFDIFATTEEAVHSFHYVRASAVPQVILSGHSHRGEESAA